MGSVGVVVRTIKVGIHTLDADTPRALALNDGLLAATDAGADVVAFLDHDCEPDESWLAALGAAWDAADPDVAVIGGTITVRSEGPQPAWCSDDLLSTFASQGKAEATFHAGNASFRTAALRGVGGFWPSRGHALGRDWFAPEHEAQRELSRAGWLAHWAPEVAVTRVVAPRLLRALRFRMRTGSRCAVVGDVGEGALRAGLRFAAGVPLSRSRAVAIDRTGRAAERLGAALGGRSARHDFEPLTAATPFRASVPVAPPPPPRFGRLGGGPRSLILVYHRVIERAYGPVGLCVSPENFAAQLDVIGDSLVELDRIVTGAAPDGSVAITFDDGYVDNLTNAAPLLAGRPATLFVCTGLNRFWWDDLWRLMEDPPIDGGLLTAAGCAWWPRDAAQREFVARQILPQLVARHPDEIQTVLDELGRDPLAGEADRRMTVDELRLAARAFAFSAHTRHHPGLARLPEDEQYTEMAGSRADLREWLGVDVHTISYPFGVPGFDVDRRTLAMAREAGFEAGLVNVSGAVAARARNPMALPRVAVPDLDADGFAAWLAEVRSESAAAVLS